MTVISKVQSNTMDVRPGGTETRMRVLVADQGAPGRRFLTNLLEADSSINVVGFVRSAEDLSRRVEQLQPDAVVWGDSFLSPEDVRLIPDLRMRVPSLILVCSKGEELGSANVSSLPGIHDVMPDNIAAALKQLYLGTPAASESTRLPLRAPSTAAAVTYSPTVTSSGSRRVIPRVLAIGVSTGGPPALASIFPLFKPDFPLPIVIVQHMPPHFTQLLAERLTKLSRIPVVEGKEGMEVKPGVAIVAPGDFHMRLVQKVNGIFVQLNQDERENSCRPAADVLFRSVAEVYGGASIVTVLTGMGQDGLLGVRQLKGLGAHVIVQDKSSSVVWGMPGAIASASLADAILPLDQIVPEVMKRL